LSATEARYEKKKNAHFKIKLCVLFHFVIRNDPSSISQYHHHTATAKCIDIYETTSENGKKMLVLAVTGWNEEKVAKLATEKK
jgi:hypothetical protein